MLYVIIALLFVMILLIAYKYWQLNGEFEESKNQAKFWFDEHNKLLGHYTQLDQGMTEITDAYETDSLQYEDTIERLNEEKRTLQGQYTTLSQKYARVRENNATLLHNATVDRTARHEMARRLDMAQVIISDHDLNCLPHIVLKSMEPQEQDTPLPL